MVKRARSQLTGTSNSYVRSAYIDSAWLNLRLRRESFSYPVVTYVRATLQTADSSDTALHEQVKFDTDEQSQRIRFELSDDSTLGIAPIVPIPEPDTAPSRDFTDCPTELTIAVEILDANTHRDYDAVTLYLERDGPEYEVIDIDD